MFTYDDALNMNYYKKTSYTGWMGGMRFLLKQEKVTEEIPDPDGALAEDGTPVTTTREYSQFHCWIWPGPYIFDFTPPEKKVDRIFPFTDEGRRQAVDWINEVYESRKEEWPRYKTEGA